MVPPEHPPAPEPPDNTPGDPTPAGPQNPAEKPEMPNSAGDAVTPSDGRPGAEAAGKDQPAAGGGKPGEGEPTETIPAAGDEPGASADQPTAGRKPSPAARGDKPGEGDSGEKPGADADETAEEGGNPENAGKPGGDEPTEALPAAAGEGEPDKGEQPTETLPATGEGDQTEVISGPGSDKPEGDDKPTEALTAVSPPTRKSNTRLLIAIGLAVLVLVGGGITIIALATQNRPEDLALQKSKAEARGVVEKFAVLFAQARNDGAFSLSKSDVKALLCSREQDALDQEWTERETKEINRSSSPPTPAARLELTIKEINIQGDAGVATLTGTIADRKTDQDFGLVKEQGLWKVCDVVFRIPRSSSSSNPTTPSDVETGTTPPDFPTSPVGENPGNTITTTTTETR